MVEKNIITNILRNNFNDFEKSHKIPRYKIKVIKNLLRCRTQEMGGNVKKCPDKACSTLKIHYNSCRNRSCPKCSFMDRKKWLDKQTRKLLNCGHYHIIFTIPDKLNELWNNNPKNMANLLFDATNTTLDIFLNDPKHLGATTGKIITLHTWGSNLSLHPHTHCLVSEGGLNSKLKWVNRNNKYLFPIKAVSTIFRASFLKKLKQEIYKGNIKTVDYKHKMKLLSLIDSLFKVKWNVHIEDKYKHGSGVLKYLTNYIKGGPIHQSRIISSNKKEVRFKAKDYKNTLKGKKPDKITMKLTNKDFITRFLLHIPYPRVKTVRYYGLYSPNSIKKLNHCKEIIGQETDNEQIDLENIDENDTKESEYCPNCGIKMVQYDYPKREVFKRVLKKLITKDPPFKKVVETP